MRANFAMAKVGSAVPISAVRCFVFARQTLVSLALGFLLCAIPLFAQAQTAAPREGSEAPPDNQPSSQRSTGIITGTIVDQSGAAVARARVTLSPGEQSQTQEASSGDDGQFSFTSVPPGPFQLTVTADGFATQTYSGTLHPGEYCVVQPIAMTVASATSKVVVTAPGSQIAEVQIKEEEKQRVLGFIPNFYVSYVPNPAPLNSKQKFELSWKTVVDPISFVTTGAIAGAQQAENSFSGYGQGAQGYAKRYGASYADLVIGNFMENAILPSLLKQDPRYFYKGTGSTHSRILYALANAVICKGDNGRWQANYSGILGGVAAGGISNLYYPPQNRGVRLMFENFGIGVGQGGVFNLFEEFVIPKLTPHLPNHQSDKS